MSGRLVENALSIQCRGGDSVFARHWPTSAPQKAVVHIAHGMAEHSARYARLAAEMTAAGYDVYAHDHRGHGRTATRTDTVGTFGAPGWNGLVDDLSSVHKWIRSQHPGVPFVAMGHSMGSYAVQQLILDESRLIAGAILSGSTAVDQITAGVDTSKPVDLGKDSTFFNARFQPERTSLDWLTRDEGEVDLYIADPLCGFPLDAEAGRTLAEAAPRLADADALAKIRPDLPMYVFAGMDDPINLDFTLINLIVSRYHHAGLKQIIAKPYLHARHETLNETNRDEVTNDLIAWLDGHIAAKARG